MHHSKSFAVRAAVHIQSATRVRMKWARLQFVICKRTPATFVRGVDFRAVRAPVDGPQRLPVARLRDEVSCLRVEKLHAIVDGRCNDSTIWSPTNVRHVGDFPEWDRK